MNNVTVSVCYFGSVHKYCNAKLNRRLKSNHYSNIRPGAKQASDIFNALLPCCLKNERKQLLNTKLGRTKRNYSDLKSTRRLLRK